MVALTIAVIVVTMAIGGYYVYQASLTDTEVHVKVEVGSSSYSEGEQVGFRLSPGDSRYPYNISYDQFMDHAYISVGRIPDGTTLKELREDRTLQQIIVGDHPSANIPITNLSNERSMDLVWDGKLFDVDRSNRSVIECLPLGGDYLIHSPGWPSWAGNNWVLFDIDQDAIFHYDGPTSSLLPSYSTFGEKMRLQFDFNGSSYVSGEIELRVMIYDTSGQSIIVNHGYPTSKVSETISVPLGDLQGNSLWVHALIETDEGTYSLGVTHAIL